MLNCSAAWMMVVPSGTVMGFWLMGTVGIVSMKKSLRGRLDSYSSFHVAAFVLDVIFKLMSELLDIAADWHGSGIRERADGGTHHVESDAQQVVKVFRASVAIVDPLERLLEPCRAFPAWCALPAGFVRIE